MFRIVNRFNPCQLYTAYAYNHDLMKFLIWNDSNEWEWVEMSKWKPYTPPVFRIPWEPME